MTVWRLGGKIIRSDCVVLRYVGHLCTITRTQCVHLPAGLALVFFMRRIKRLTEIMVS